MVISLNHHHHRHDWRLAFTEHHAAVRKQAADEMKLLLRV